MNDLEAQKHSARNAVSVTVRCGFLRRPETCSKCGLIPERRRNGISGIEAHHHNGYYHALDIVWLCGKCHREADRHSVRQQRAAAEHAYRQKTFSDLPLNIDDAVTFLASQGFFTTPAILRKIISDADGPTFTRPAGRTIAFSEADLRRWAFSRENFWDGISSPIF